MVSDYSSFVGGINAELKRTRALSKDEAGIHRAIALVSLEATCRRYRLFTPCFSALLITAGRLIAQLNARFKVLIPLSEFSPMDDDCFV